MKYSILASIAAVFVCCLLVAVRTVPIPIPVPIPRPIPAPIPIPAPLPYPYPIIYDRLLGKLAVPAVIAGGYLATAAVGGLAGALAAKLHKPEKEGKGGYEDHWGFHDELHNFNAVNKPYY